MKSSKSVPLGAAFLIVLTQGHAIAAGPTVQDAFGPRYAVTNTEAEPVARYAGAAVTTLADRVRYWNEAALRANAIDHTPPPPGSSRRFGEQYGPVRSARALAIVHLAIFDAANAVLRRYPAYTGMGVAPADSSPDAAVAKAAHDALAALYPSQARDLDSMYARDMSQVADGRAENNGVDTGRRAAAAMLALYPPGDNVEDAIVGVNFFPGNAPGKWRPDPVSGSRLALGAFWRGQRPFVVPGLSGFRPAAPPALGSSAYAAAFNEVKWIGGDGVTTPTHRTAQQTIAGIYWSYDGLPGVGAPPRLYNQIAVQVAKQRAVGGMELARLLAMVNVAIADTSLVVWRTKYEDQYWRPVTGIREADPGTGPTGLGDGNAATRGDVRWTPLGAQASNTTMPDFTPPFPAYPSGHAAFGSAMFQVLRRVLGTDAIGFTFVSDEFNGITRDNSGVVRPRLPRSFASLSQAEEEDGQSRIYLGVHWSFDKTAGIQIGRAVADYVVEHSLVAPSP